MNKMNNVYDLIFQLHNEVIDSMYDRKSIEYKLRDKEEIIEKLRKENFRLADKIHELEDKENQELSEKSIDELREIYLNLE